MTPKRYRIEPAPRAREPGPADDRLDAILAALRAIQRTIEPGEQFAAEAVDACRRDLHEVFTLRSELDAMKEAITSTKLEIATLHRSENEGKGMRRVAGELDAVVEATEQATTAILAAVEDIETHASVLRAAGAAGANVDAILERTVALYEACNFQDLTGQRIGKIVGVLKFVEDRLDRVIGVWGGLDAFKDFAEPDGAPVDPDRALINGPKLADDPGHVDQSDIDALFD